MNTKTKNTVALLGRFAVTILGAIFIEGMMTLGTAFQFEHYNVVAWIAQVAALVVCCWVAVNWHCEELDKQNK